MLRKGEKRKPTAEGKLSSKGSESPTKHSNTSDKSDKKCALQFQSVVTVMTPNISEDSSFISKNSLPETSEISSYPQTHHNKRMPDSSEVTSIYTMRKHITNTPDESCTVDDFERNLKPQPLSKDKILLSNTSFNQALSCSDCKDTTTVLVDDSFIIDDDDVFLAFADTGLS